MKQLLAAPRRVLAVGALAAVAVVVAAGYGYAAVTATNNTYTGCLVLGVITKVNVGTAPKQPCSTAAEQISWNQTGVPGATGAKGNTGAQGIQGLKGDKGDPGTNGAKGDKGDPGTPGTNGTNGTNGTDGKDAEPGFHPLVRWNFDIPATDGTAPDVHGLTEFPAGTTLELVSALITGISDVPTGCNVLDVGIQTNEQDLAYFFRINPLDTNRNPIPYGPASDLSAPSTLQSRFAQCYFGFGEQNRRPVPGFPHVTGYITLKVNEGPVVIE